MALINKKIEEKISKVKAELPESIVEEIHQYIEWADLPDLNYFLQEASSHVFSSDRDWKKHKKNIKKNHSKTDKKTEEIS